MSKVRAQVWLQAGRKSRRTLLLLPALLLLVPATGLCHVSYNLVVDDKGNAYFLDVLKNSVVRVSAQGSATELVDLRKLDTWDRPHALAIDGNGNLYVGATYEEKIWQVSSAGAVSLFYPSPHHETLGSNILHLGFDDSGALYVCAWDNDTNTVDWGTERIRILRYSDPEKKPAELFAGTEGNPDFPSVKGHGAFHAGSMLVTGNGSVFLSGSHRIWKVGDGKLMPVAGTGEPGFVDGQRDEARFDQPHGMAVDANGDILVAELSSRIRRMTPTGVVSTIARSCVFGGEEAGRSPQNT